MTRKSSFSSKKEVGEVTILGRWVSHCHWDNHFTPQFLKNNLFIKEFKIEYDLLSANFSTTLCPTLLHYSIFWMYFDPYTHLKFPNFFPLLLLFPLQRILSSFPSFSLTTFPTCFCMFKLYHPLKVHFPPFYYENVQSRNKLYSEQPYTHLLDPTINLWLYLFYHTSIHLFMPLFFHQSILIF